MSHLVFIKKDGELKLYVYDVLDQNRSLVRNVTDTYVEDVQSQVLNRYFMLSFTYNLRNFAGIPGQSRAWFEWPAGDGTRTGLGRWSRGTRRSAILTT